MYLTHIDANGQDSPAILIDNATAANRAVNLPEFVNMAPDAIEDITPHVVKEQLPPRPGAPATAGRTGP
jgi:hypothetical protein